MVSTTLQVRRSRKNSGLLPESDGTALTAAPRAPWPLWTSLLGSLPRRPPPGPCTQVPVLSVQGMVGRGPRPALGLSVPAPAAGGWGSSLHSTRSPRTQRGPCWSMNWERPEPECPRPQPWQGWEEGSQHLSLHIHPTSREAWHPHPLRKGRGPLCPTCVCQRCLPTPRSLGSEGKGPPSPWGQRSRPLCPHRSLIWVSAWGRSRLRPTPQTTAPGVLPSGRAGGDSPRVTGEPSSGRPGLFPRRVGGPSQGDSSFHLQAFHACHT